MNDTNENLYWSAVASDFNTFLQHAFATIYPGKEFMGSWHIDAIVHCLEQGFEGKMPRLIINLPPRYLKSFIVSVAWPAFVMGLDPCAKIICVSYSDELARMLSRDCKRLLESGWYPRVFPNVKVTKASANEIVTSDGGGRYATSVGGTLTGRGGDFIIVDDPIKAEDALSDRARQTNNEWFKTTLLSRLDDKKRSVLILVMQRLHVNDLTGYIEGSGEFHKLSLPAIAVRDETIALSDDRHHHRRAGEPLHAELESLETLEKMRNQLGPHTFAAQYQQRPDAPEGTLIKRKYINLIKHEPNTLGNVRYWISIDSASSTSETADYSAITIGRSDRNGHVILHAERGRWDFEALLQKSVAYEVKIPRVTFIIENAGSGISLIYALRKRRFNVFFHEPRGDKTSRVAMALPIFAEGRFFIVDREGQNHWVSPLVNELLSFPFGRFDDQVDSVAQALRWAEPIVNPQGRNFA